MKLRRGEPGEFEPGEFEPGELRPGEFPYTRGVYHEMYRSRLWTMRQYAGFGTAEESNRRYRYLLSQGTTGLSVAFDLPTQMGFDSDHPMASGEVGRAGVAISSLADMERLFQEIPLQNVSTSMTINSTAAVLLAFYALVAQRQGALLRTLSGTIQNDILKEYVARGTYIYPPRPAMRIITDVFAWAGREMPEWNTISISGYHIREAGSTAVQELAFTFANAIAYIEGAMAAGLAVDSFAPRLSFFFNSHNDFLEEIAKFRAARRIYAHLMRDRFGAMDPRSRMLRFDVQTAGSTLTAQQPDVNIVRTAIQAMAAVLGGAQSLHTNSRDEALALPTEESARIALRTQQIIAYESGVTNTVDPAGGSQHIEGLTDSIEQGVLDYLKRIDDAGGTLRAIETGYIQNEIQNAAYEYQRAIESGRRIVVGVNRFQQEDGCAVPTFRLDPALEQAQVAGLRQVRAMRSQSAVAEKLGALEQAARSGENLMPPILDAADAYATVGEISDRLRGVFGEYREG
ncbi:MAG TPA: methylmalonyl-CoA mutase family protein [Candidatus Acidoferrales bacterium]|jgi:methylmalonyl-CoA mutase N-terminal domain/subunit|nr:methylmalonyl-CoA mutase family protein [Candidatus Acidoferrales bacterium]